MDILSLTLVLWGFFISAFILYKYWKTFYIYCLSINNYRITCLDENKNEYTLKTTDNHIHLVAGKGNRSTVELEIGDKFYIENLNIWDYKWIYLDEFVTVEELLFA